MIRAAHSSRQRHKVLERSRALYGAACGWTFTDYEPSYCECADGRLTGGFTTNGRPVPEVGSSGSMDGWRHSGHYLPIGVFEGIAMAKYAYLYVLDTLADWEPGYAIAELNSGRFFEAKRRRLPVKTVGATAETITTMGGLRIVPDVVLKDVAPERTAMFIVAGADTWFDPAQVPAVDKVKELLAAGVNVAAICGATGALANAGVFDHRPHTSNSLTYLEMFAPGYKGKAQYVDAPAVVDENLVTAGSAGSLLFAKYILRRLGVFSAATLEAWYNYFDTGDQEHFFAMMRSLPQSPAPEQR